MAKFNRSIWALAALKAVIAYHDIMSTVIHDIDVKENEKVMVPYITDKFEAQEGKDNDTTFGDVSNSVIEIETDKEAFKGFRVKRIDEISSNIKKVKEYSAQVAKAIRKKINYNILGGIASTADKKVTMTVANDNVTTDVMTYDIILYAAEQLDNAEAPAEDRYLAVKPKHKKQLFKIKDDAGQYIFTKAADMGKPSLIKGVIGEILGFTVIMSTNIPKVTVAGNISSTPANNIKEVAVFYQREAHAAGAEKAIAVDTVYNSTKRATDVVESMKYGHKEVNAKYAVAVRENGS